MRVATDKKVVAFCGTRGVPANYGGFETVVEQLSRRFCEQGVETEVFCRETSFGEHPEEDSGRHLIWVKGSRRRELDTFVSAFQTGWHILKNRRRYRFVFWYNNANLPGILMTLFARVPMAVNTNGLEWRRAKWSFPFKAYYYIASWLIAKLCPVLVSDSIAIQAFYRQRFGAMTHFIPYGVAEPPEVGNARAERILDKYDLERDRYFLQVTRFEPDNLPLEVARGFKRSDLGKSGYKMVLVGYKDTHEYAREVKKLDGADGIVVLDPIYDQETLRALRENAVGYVHGNSVGGTNPALLEAMLSCARVAAIDVTFSREVLAETGTYFEPDNLATVFREMVKQEARGEELTERVRRHYRWDEVCDAYYRLSIGDKADYCPERGQFQEMEIAISA